MDRPNSAEVWRIIFSGVRAIVVLLMVWVLFVALRSMWRFGLATDQLIITLIALMGGVAATPEGPKLLKRARLALGIVPTEKPVSKWTLGRILIALLYLVWALYILFLVRQFLRNIELLGGLPQSDTFLFDMRTAVRMNLIFILWGLVGAVWTSTLWFNHGRSGRWLVKMGFALPLALGLPLLGWASHFLTMIPPGPVLDLIKFGFAPPILMWLGGTLALAGIGLTVTGVFIVLVGVPVMVFNQINQFFLGVHVWRYQRNGLLGFVQRFGYWLSGETPPPAPPDDSKGARAATPEEIEALRNPQGMGFGYANGTPLFLHTEKHVLIQASTRSGKGVALIIPHLLRYPGSVFVLDPKGENAYATGRQRAKLNDKVHYLDPFGISRKPQSRFNPLSRFTKQNMEAESKALAAALVLGNEHGERDHWSASGQQLLAALILYVYASPSIKPEQKDLASVRRLLLGAMQPTLREMVQSKIADGLVADLASSFLQTPEKEFGSILSHAQRETEILDNPFIIASLRASGPQEHVNFADWRTGTMSVFLCLAAPKFPTFNRWLRLILTAALDEMTDVLRPPPLPICFMLDELATLGNLKVVENAVGLAAGYGIQLVSVFQDVAQMRDLYKGRWASFIGNAGVRALFNLDDFDTAEYWSKFMGGRLVDTLSQQQDIYGLSHGQTAGETVRPFMTPEEIMQTFAQNHMLVLPTGSHPITTFRVLYFKDRTLDGLWDNPRELADEHDSADGTSPQSDHGAPAQI